MNQIIWDAGVLAAKHILDNSVDPINIIEHTPLMSESLIDGYNSVYYSERNQRRIDGLNDYLGSKIIEAKETPFKDYTEKDWALYFIDNYGQYESTNEKAWVLDQVSRILNGSPVEIHEASWSNGNTEYRIIVGKPSVAYNNWLENQDLDDYDFGTAP